jgi:hypothetical protein
MANQMDRQPLALPAGVWTPLVVRGVVFVMVATSLPNSETIALIRDLFEAAFVLPSPSSPPASGGEKTMPAIRPPSDSCIRDLFVAGIRGQLRLLISPSSPFRYRPWPVLGFSRFTHHASRCHANSSTSPSPNLLRSPDAYSLIALSSRYHLFALSWICASPHPVLYCSYQPALGPNPFLE